MGKAARNKSQAKPNNEGTKRKGRNHPIREMEHNYTVDPLTLDLETDKYWLRDMVAAIEKKPCSVCKTLTKSVCYRCLMKAYCSKNCRQSDYERHCISQGEGDDLEDCECQPVRNVEIVMESATSAVSLKTTRAVKAGEILFEGSVSLIFPADKGVNWNGERSCYGCHEPFDVETGHKCSQCGLILCSSKCENERRHDIFECLAMKEMNIRYSIEGPTSETDTWPELDDVCVMRALVYFIDHVEEWHHFNLLSQTPRYKYLEDCFNKTRDINEFQMSYRFTNNQPQLVKRVYVLITIFSEDFVMDSGHKERTLHILKAALTHSCEANVMSTTLTEVANLPLEKPMMSVKAIANLAKGTILRHNFGGLEWGSTYNRLKAAGIFPNCNCSRCRDPTELGSFTGCSPCRVCTDGFYILSEEFTQNMLKTPLTWDPPVDFSFAMGKCDNKKCEGGALWQWIKYNVDRTLFDKDEEYRQLRYTDEATLDEQMKLAKDFIEGEMENKKSYFHATHYGLLKWKGIYLYNAREKLCADFGLELLDMYRCPQLEMRYHSMVGPFPKLWNRETLEETRVRLEYANDCLDHLVLTKQFSENYIFFKFDIGVSKLITDFYSYAQNDFKIPPETVKNELNNLHGYAVDVLKDYELYIYIKPPDDLEVDYWMVVFQKFVLSIERLMKLMNGRSKNSVKLATKLVAHSFLGVPLDKFLLDVDRNDHNEEDALPTRSAKAMARVKIEEVYDASKRTGQKIMKSAQESTLEPVVEVKEEIFQDVEILQGDGILEANVTVEEEKMDQSEPEVPKSQPKKKGRKGKLILRESTLTPVIEEDILKDMEMIRVNVNVKEATEVVETGSEKVPKSQTKSRKRGRRGKISKLAVESILEPIAEEIFKDIEVDITLYENSGNQINLSEEASTTEDFLNTEGDEEITLRSPPLRVYTGRKKLKQ